MSDKIELTEEQAREIWKAIDYNEQYDWALWTLQLKTRNMIKQNPTERALEIIDKAKERYKHHMDIQIQKPEFDEIENTILDLKKQLENKS